MVKVTGTAGLGHRFSEILFGFHLSQQTNSTFVLDEESLYYSAGAHGSYEWFRDFLPLDKTEITLRELSSWHSQQRLVDGRWDSVVGLAKRNSSGCGVYYVTTAGSCCNNEADPGCAHGCWGALFGIYEDFRWKIAEAFEFSAFRLSTDLYRHPHFDSMLSIAWHLRSGDIVLNNNQTYFETVARQLLFLTKYIPAHFFLHGQNVRKIFPFVEDICENLLSGNCSFPELNTQDSLFHLVYSDVLITSGSSFAYLAAALQKNVVINSFPKGGILGVFELGDHGQMDREGNIFHPPVTQLRDRVKTYYFHKLKMSEHLG
mmetsp:Transcript_11658/g.19364  ORF Transcript_11658/g.19364 Transcript_11658/m.19364 type:complete len:317 (-) Transcript_11658:992-1942(-)